jgi:hypothetical protein
MALKNVAVENRIPWTEYTVSDDYAVNFLVNTGVLTASSAMLKLMLSFERYKMYRYKENNVWKAGYGFTDPEDQSGPTETEAYTHWRKSVFVKQQRLINQLPLISMTQSQFDGLLSLYVSTGKWRTVQGANGHYDLENAIKSNRWTLVADMIANGKFDHTRRIQEARAIVLAEYSTSYDRQWLLKESMRNTVTQYKRNLLDTKQKRQAEIAYYRETESFLPGMTDQQKKVILRLAPSESTTDCGCD